MYSHRGNDNRGPQHNHSGISIEKHQRHKDQQTDEIMRRGTIDHIRKLGKKKGQIGTGYGKQQGSESDLDMMIFENQAVIL